MKRKLSMLLVMLLVISICTEPAFAASSPAWSAADPVVCTMDIDNVGSAFHWNNVLGWQPGGTYQSEYTFDTAQSKDGYDGSKYLRVEKKADGTVGHRGDLRVKFYMEAIAGDFDFFVDNTSTSSNIAFKCNLNLQDKTNTATQAETALIQVAGDSIKLADNSTVKVTNGAWYRTRYIVNKADMTVEVAVYSLKEDGTLGSLVKETNPVKLTALDSTDWQIQRYTVELYGAPGVVCGFDNFVLYNQGVNAASFSVGEGGEVAFGSNKITSESKGTAKEVAVGEGEELSFAVIPKEGYEVESVVVGGEDKTALFENTQEAVSVGALDENTEIAVSFTADSGTVKPSLVGSPAWGKTAPIVDIIDFDTYTSTWSKAGAYSANYSYDAEAVKTTGDQSKFLKITKTTGASGQRGDARITFSNGQTAAAGSLDFCVNEGSADENILARVQLNLTDGTTQKETAIADIKAEKAAVSGTGGAAIQQGSWYRIYYDLNKEANTASVSLYSLDESGHVKELLTPAQTVALTAGLEDNWYVNRYTMEMYSKEGAGVGFDNFVLYDRPVKFVSFAVGQGGTVSLGQERTIAANMTGYQSEVVIETGSSLNFAVIPEADYQVAKVLVGEQDMTAQFADHTSVVAVGTAEDHKKVEISFQTDVPSAPVIFNGVITGSLVLNSVVSVDYQFEDENGDQEDETKTEIIWERSPDGQVWTPISGAEGRTYTITSADVKNYLRAKITAYADQAPFESNQLVTESYGPVSGNIYEISSPAWRNAPVLKNVDFDVDATGWSKAGAYLTTMNYNPDAVKTEGDGSKYLEITRESGAAGQRADLRLRFGQQTAVAFDFDFKVKGIYGDTQGLGLVNLNVTDGTTTAPETRLTTIKGNSFGEASIQSNTWYRVRAYINKEAETFDYELFALDSEGKMTGSLYSRSNNALNVTGLKDDWYVNGFTVEMYGAPESMIAFDNFVVYSAKVNTATFNVHAGGKVVIGDNEITADEKGTASETAVSAQEALVFGVVPDEGYTLRSVLIDGVDRTEWFLDDEPVDIGTLKSNCIIDVMFQSSQASAPVISDAALSGLGVVGSELTVKYNYFDANYDEEDEEGAMIKWQRSSDGKENWTDISDASGRSYIVTEADNNCFLRAVIVAKAAAEPFYSNELATPAFAVGSKNFYVAADGNDENDGSLERPFATITAARDAIRAGREDGSLSSGSIVVNIRGGHYSVTEQIVFDERDSGVEGNPVIYQAYGDEKVVFEGGKEIASSKAVKVTDQAILDRVLDDTAKNRLMMIDLGAEGIDVPAMIDYGHALNTSWRPYEIYINGSPLEKSVWPNPDSDLGKFIRTTSAELTGEDNAKGPFVIGYTDTENHTEKWTEETVKNMMIGGFLSNDFSCQHMQVASLDAASKTLVTKGGCNYAPGANKRFYFWNMLEEIDQPGESYIDRENDIVYFYPATDMENAEIVVSTMGKKMLVVNQGSNIIFRNLGFEYTRETAAEVTGNNITFDGCTIAHTSGTGMIVSGIGNTIENCNIYDCGYGGINISGGDRVNLISSENVIRNNRIHDVGRVKETYSPAINVSGMGVTMTHNELYNNASQIIGMTGNDHLIAYNNIYDAVLESADQGAVYWGRNPSELGIRIMYNYFHDMENDYGGYGHQAVFWDDGAYGPFVYGNVFFRASNTKATGQVSLTNALKTNGGNFSHIQNNIFIDGANAFNPHPWNSGSMAYGWWLFMYDKYDLRYNPVYQEKMCAVPVNGETWTNHYQNFTWTDENGETFSTDLWSHLSSLFQQKYADDMQDHDRLTDQDFLYKYAQENGASYSNVFEGNVCVDITQNINNNRGQATEKNTFNTTNHQIFKDYGTDFTLTEAGLNTVRSTIPGFENVPFEDMGLTSAVGGTAPVVSSAVILGESGTGDTVKASYVFQDADGDKEGISKFDWYLADSENGTYERIGCRDYQLTIKPEYKNKYLKYQITPIDRNGVTGEAVMSDPICVGKTLTAADTLQEVIRQSEELYNNTVIGSQFGNVTAQTAQILANALQAAKETDLEDTDAVYAAIRALNTAVSEFKASVITALPDPITSGGTYEIEPFMGNLEFHIAAGVSGVNLSLPVGEALQEIKAQGYITVDGKKIATSFTIPEGTVITAEADRVTLRLFGDDATPSQTVALAQEGKITAIHTSDKLLSLSQPAVYLFDGIEKSKVAGALTEKYSSISSVIDSVDEMSGTYARLNTSNGFGIVAKELQEFVLYTRNSNPSPTVSPTTVPTAAPPVNGGGTSIIGGGGSKPAVTPTNPFVDTVSHWAKDDILTMYQKGIVAGVTATTFEPDREITRAEFAALMVRALKITVPGELNFTDVGQDEWYAESVRIAAYAGLVKGYDGKFRPEDTITREEMAVVIAKGYDLLGHTSEKGAIEQFTDCDKISDWAWDSVDIAATAGIISGMDDGRFAPSENATRAQAASLLKRLLSK